MVILAVTFSTIGQCGWCGKDICGNGDVVKEPSIATMRGELYVARMVAIS